MNVCSLDKEKATASAIAHKNEDILSQEPILAAKSQRKIEQPFLKANKHKQTKGKPHTYKSLWMRFHKNYGLCASHLSIENTC